MVTLIPVTSSKKGFKVVFIALEGGVDSVAKDTVWPLKGDDTSFNQSIISPLHSIP